MFSPPLHFVGQVGAVAVASSGDQSHGGHLTGFRHDGKSLVVEGQSHPSPSAHLPGVSRQAEARHIGAGTYIEAPQCQGGPIVELGQDLRDPDDKLFGQHIGFDRGGEDSHSQGFAKEQPVPDSGGVVSQDPLGMDESGDAEPIGHLRSFDGMAPHQQPSALPYLVGTSCEDLFEHASGMVASIERDDVHRRGHLGSHGEDIAETVGRGDLPIEIGVVHHRSDHIQGLDHRLVLVQTDHRSIVAALGSYQDPIVLAEEIRQKFCEVLRTQFGGSAGGFDVFGKFRPVVELSHGRSFLLGKDSDIITTCLFD